MCVCVCVCVPNMIVRVPNMIVGIRVIFFLNGVCIPILNEYIL